MAGKTKFRKGINRTLTGFGFFISLCGYDKKESMHAGFENN